MKKIRLKVISDNEIIQLTIFALHSVISMLIAKFQLPWWLFLTYAVPISLYDWFAYHYDGFYNDGWFKGSELFALKVFATWMFIFALIFALIFIHPWIRM